MVVVTGALLCGFIHLEEGAGGYKHHVGSKLPLFVKMLANLYRVVAGGTVFGLVPSKMGCLLLLRLLIAYYQTNPKHVMVQEGELDNWVA